MSSIEERYSIWGVDKLVYGPIDRETLIRWTRDGRVTSETWVHDKHIDFWLQGEKIDFIKPELGKHEAETIRVGASPDADEEEVKLTPDRLRSFELFSELSDHKLEQIIMFSSIRKFAGGTIIVRKGEPGKSLYLIVEGHVTASITVGSKKEKLAEIGEGDFFGELALFTRMPRSADVYADLSTVTLVLDFDTLELMARELPELSSVILIRMGKVLALRILEDNKRYQERVAGEFLWI